MYNRECHTYMQNNPGISITKYAIAELTARPYVKAMSPENLTSAFKKAGMFPFNNSVISVEQVAPSIIYKETEEPEPDQADAAASDANSDYTINYSTLPVPVISHNSKQALQIQKPCTPPILKNICEKGGGGGVSSRRGQSPVWSRSLNLFVPPFLAGSLMKKANMEILSAAAKKSKSTVKTVSVKPTLKTMSAKTPINTVSGKYKVKKCSKVVSGPATSKKIFEPMPSTSGLNNNKGAPLDLTSEDNVDSDFSYLERETCCKCGLWEPKAFRDCTSLLIAKWAQCDFCSSLDTPYLLFRGQGCEAW